MRGEQEIDGVMYKEVEGGAGEVCTGCAFHSPTIGCLIPLDSPSCGDGILVIID